MEIKERQERAVTLKNGGGCNCCQAVVMALSDQTDLAPETLKLIAAGFGGGVGTMEATCGALVGAAMIAGLRTEGAATVRHTRQIAELFRQKCGAETCKELKGRDTGKVLSSCDDCVRNAVAAYAQVLGLAD